MKENIKIMTGVYCPNDFRGHRFMTAELPWGLLQRIQKMAAFVKAERIYSVTWFEYAISVFDAQPGNAKAFDVVTYEYARTDEDEPYEAESQDLECVELIVTEDGFRWQWLPKHGDNSETCNSDDIYLADVEAAFAKE